MKKVPIMGTISRHTLHIQPIRHGPGRLLLFAVIHGEMVSNLNTISQAKTSAQLGRRLPGRECEPTWLTFLPVLHWRTGSAVFTSCQVGRKSPSSTALETPPFTSRQVGTKFLRRTGKFVPSWDEFTGMDPYRRFFRKRKTISTKELNTTCSDTTTQSLSLWITATAI